MLLSDTSVKRPILAMVLSCVLLVFGLISFDRMSLQEYPNVESPVVVIKTDYLGASAQVVESRITKLIESRIAGISGIKYISSTSSDGRSTIRVEFNLKRDIDHAANDIRDRVSSILDRLPEQATAPEVEKADGNDSVIVWFNLSSDRMSVAEITDYAERYLVDRFSVIDGVARVRVGGGQSYALRIWLQPQKMAQYGIHINEIEQRLNATNVELPSGSLQGQSVLLSMQVTKPLTSVEALEKLVIKQDGLSQIRLQDIARIELGAIEKRRLFQGNGLPMVGIGVIKQSNANTLEVARLARDKKEELKQTLPEGITLNDSYDASIFVQSALNEVYKTLFIALGLVILVMLIFLRNARAALIPAVTLPISIIATFWVLWMFGFSINLLTLLAIVLAIGLIVDDAIVVLENTQRHLDQGYQPIAAAYLGARQVGFAVISTTLVLISVFMPIAFLEGSLGHLFSEFAITLAVAVLFSSWVALTLSPALASKILKSSPSAKATKLSKKPKKRRAYFRRFLTFNLRYPWLSLILFAGIIAAAWPIYQQTPQEYAPKEDRGAFFIMIKGPEGATFDYMQHYALEIERRLMPLVESGEAKRVLIRTPLSFSNTQTFNTGFGIVVLNDWAQRRSAFEIIKTVRQNLADLPGIFAFPVMRSGIRGRVEAPVQFVISGRTYEELVEWKHLMIQAIAENNPGLIGVDWDYAANQPQLKLLIDYPRATALGVDQKTLSESLQTFLGSKRVGTYLHEGEEYPVILEADRLHFQSPEDLNKIYLPTSSGEMVSLGSLVSWQTYAGASNLNRHNRLRALTLTAKLEDDLPLGEALDYLQQLTRNTLPDHAQIDFKGPSKDFKQSQSSTEFVFIFALIIIFLVLAAQFESFVSPLVILLSVPLALIGGFLALWVHGISLNLFSQMALVLLLGLATKNGILIVEFSNQLRDQGYSLHHAVLRATQLRLRPIIMTTLTTCAGAIPLMLSFGAGSETRQILGYVLFWGVAFSTILSLLIIPILYSLIAKHAHAPSYTSRKLEQALQANPKE